MKRRTLLKALAVAVIGIVMLNWLLAVRLSNTPPHVFRHLILNSPSIDTIAIGNSVIAAGFDAAIFDQAAGGASFNAGLGGVGFVQQYVAWRLISGKHSNIKRLVFGTFDHSLTHTPPSHWTSWHSNDSLAFYTDPTWAIPYGCMNTADKAAFRLMRQIPLFTERGALWSKVENLRRLLGNAGMPSAKSNRFGRVADAAQLLEENKSKFELRCTQAIQSHATLAPPIDDLLNEARQKGISSFVVMMPLPKTRHLFYTTPEWRAYVDYVRGLLSKSGAQLIEATEWAGSPEDFDDSIHLSKTGSILFSRRLAEVMHRLGP